MPRPICLFTGQWADLPLEALAPGEDSGSPLAVSEPQGTRRRIVLCNEAASAAGIRVGMNTAAARVLAEHLCLLERDPGREIAALEGLALWAGSFTSQVSLAPPWGLLLELGGSLRLFRGADPLVSQIRYGLQNLGYQALLCLAPTPGGALLLAEDGREGVIRDPGELRQALTSVPLHRIPLEREKRNALYAMGLRRLGDLMALPEAGLGRRLGQEFMHYLERILGQAPDPRRLFEPPAWFQRRLELPAEVRSTTALRFAARRLILELSGFLLARQAGTQRLDWLLRYEAGGMCRFRLGLLAPTREPERFQGLLRERLERLELTAPVREVGLRVRDIQPLNGQSLSLFAAEEEGGREAEQRLLERLRARLGAGVVSGIGLVPDHRPELAWRRCAPEEAASGCLSGTDGENSLSGCRPLWLLAEPVPLEVRDGRPWYGSRLDLGAECERIETGWWDEDSIARDYYTAINPRGMRLWVFRTRSRDADWYLHGFFG